MEIKLSGLQDVQRIIETRVQGIIQRAKDVLQREVDELESDIKGRLGSMAGALESIVEGDKITLILHYEYAGGKTARWQNNPYFWSKNKGSQGISLSQPFQDALTLRGYTNISPARGEEIEPSHGTAPNVRITATLPPDLIKEITR